MNQNLRFATLLAVCGSLALQLGACGKRKPPPPRPPVSVKTVAAVNLDAPVVITTFGNTQDRESVDIVAQVSGKLIRTFIRDGAVVTNGQPLFQIDPSDSELKVRQGEAAVAADRANLQLARTTLERNRGLLSDKMISQQEYDTLQARADAAVAQLAMEEAALEQMRLNLSRCMITSTVAGVCSKRYLDDGNFVSAGVTKLTNIRSYDPITVEFSVSEEYLPYLRSVMTGDTVRIEITPRGDTNRYPGTLDFLDNAVSPLTGTILLRGRAPNPDLKLWAGQFVEVSILAGIHRNAVMVPEGSVQYGKQGPYLFVVSKDNTAELRSVKPGVRYDNLIQILEGVEGGENVVVLGQLMLYPGAPVMDLSHRPPENGGAPADAGRK